MGKIDALAAVRLLVLGTDDVKTGVVPRRQGKGGAVARIVLDCPLEQVERQNNPSLLIGVTV